MKKTTHYKGFMNDEMRLYVAKCISEKGEVKCAKCGSLEHLEFHHKKYENATVNDIEILCVKCHRNAKISKNQGSEFKTFYEDGQRFCEVGKFRFAY